MESTIYGAVLALLADIQSELNGRRNYSIVTHDKKFYAGGYGQLNRRGLFSWSLYNMAKHNIWIRHYTYKKDFDIVVSKLLSAGYEKKS